MEIKFFYFFLILSLGMAGFGRAFLPILTQQEGRKAVDEYRISNKECRITK